VATDFLVQSEHFGIEAKIEQAIEEVLDPFRIAAFIVDQKIDFVGVYGLSLAQNRFYLRSDVETGFPTGNIQRRPRQ
jgi:hypothetical protein